MLPSTDMHVREFIEKYYPEYYSIERYPADKTAAFCKIDQEWGIFSNFGHSPLTVGGILFDTSERLFQVMKFIDEISRKVVYTKKGNPKMTAKHFEREGMVRPDWGRIIVDAMKFCLMEKYRQCEEFRHELERCRGLFIVEDQTTFQKKNPDTWGAKPSVDGKEFIGPDLMGRLLMELRENGKLGYKLPDDATSFQDLANL